jgi:hypothetical protein
MLRAPEGVSLVINFGMATIILIMGFAMLLTDIYGDLIQRPNRTYLGLIFLAYAGFRYMRGWQIYKRNQRDEERKRWKKL